MERFKGTKGKWNVDGHGANILKKWVDVCPKDGIPHLRAFYGYASGDPITKEEAQANALLISKAPEMLEILEKLTNTNPMHEGYHKLKLEAINLIKQATEL